MQPLKITLKGLQDGLVGKSTCHQTWGPKFNPWNPHKDGKENPNPQSCPLSSVHAL